MQCRQLPWLIAFFSIAMLFAAAARASFFSVSTDSEKNLPISLSKTGISFVSEGKQIIEVSADDVLNSLSSECSNVIFISHNLICGQACANLPELPEGQQIAGEISDSHQLLQETLALLLVNSQPVISPEVLPFLYSYIYSYLPAMDGARLRKLIRQALQRAMAHYLLLTANTDMASSQVSQADKTIKLWLLFVYWLNLLAKGTLPNDTETRLVSGFNGGLEQNAGQVTIQSINRLFSSILDVQKLTGAGGDLIVNILLREITKLKPGSAQGFFVNNHYGILLVHHLADDHYVVVTPTGLSITVDGQVALSQLLDKILGNGVVTPGAGVTLPAVRFNTQPAPTLTQARQRQETSQTKLLLAAAQGAVGTAVGGAACMVLLSRAGIRGSVNTLIGLYGGIFIGLLSMAGTPLDFAGAAHFLRVLRLYLSGAKPRRT